MTADRARSLARRSWWGLAAGAALLMVMAAGLAGGEFVAERRVQLATIVAELGDLQRTIEALRTTLGNIEERRAEAASHPGQADSSVVAGDKLLLRFLQQLLDRQDGLPGRMLIVDDRGEVLAGGEKQAATGGTPLRKLADFLPTKFAGLSPAQLPHFDTTTSLNSPLVMELLLSPSSWHLIFIEGHEWGMALAYQRMIYLVMMTFMIVVFICMYLVLQYYFIQPALKLAHRVQDQSDGRVRPVPPLPKFWQPWFETIDAAFQSGRQHLARAREEQVLKNAIVQAALDCIVTTDAAGRVVEFNEGAEVTFGYRRAEVLGRPIGELIVPAYLRDQHARGMDHYLATGEQRIIGRRIETQALRADGSQLPVELALAEVNLEDRRLFTAYIRDLTRQRRMEQALQDSEARLRAVVEDQTELICRYDADFRLTFSNQAHARLFGVDPDRLLGQDLFEPLPAALRAPLRAELLGLTPEHPIRTGENQKVLSTGEVRWFAWTNRALFDAAGQRIGYQSTGRDITQAKQAELMLKETAAELALITDSIPVAVTIARTDRPEILFANRQAQDIFGLHPADGRDRIARSPGTVADYERLLGSVAGAERIEGGELRMQGADGKELWALISARTIHFRGATALLAVITDITARREMEQIARNSEARFLAAAESIPDGLVILDADDRIVYYNSRHTELLPEVLREGLRLGVRFEDWIRDGLTRGPVYHADMGPDYAQQRLSTRRVERNDREHKHADGRWVRVREGRMPDGGRVLLTIDVTARREAEERLRQSEARYRAVVEGQTEFILRLRPDGILTFVNEAYCRYRRLRREMLLAGIDDLDHYAPEQRARFHAAWASLSTARPTVTYEILVHGEDGLQFEEWTDTAIFDGAGQLLEIQSVGRDITERKRAEAEVRQQREALHHQEKLVSLGSLLAGVAHELNNPLSVVLGRAILLEKSATDPAAKLSLGRLRTAAERCARIIRSFLALARQKPREPQPIDVGAILDTALEILAYGLRSAGIEILRDDTPNLPAVVADEDQVHQVLVNLILNAQQALESIPAPRQLWLRTAARDGMVLIEVADNGPGVPMTLRSQIFEPFFTTKPVGAGTGLGLSVCHGIVAAHGGTITVGERAGGGARFVVSLPLSQAQAAAVSLETAVLPAGPTGDIVVIDDEPEVVAMLKEILTGDGYRVVTAADGAEALKIVRAGRFDAILCDLRMPHLDGSRFAEALADEQPDLAARVLFMTGDLLRAAAGTPPSFRDRLLEKPLDPEEVRRRVQELIAEYSDRDLVVHPLDQ